MPEDIQEFTLELEQIKDFEFRVRFDKPQYADLQLDEPAPLGADTAPNASRILAAAVANCLTASLLFCARKSRADLGPLHTHVTARIVRNERQRLRIGAIDVEIDPQFSDPGKASRCLELFEDFCMVTESVRHGIPIAVSVKGAGPRVT